MSKVRRIDIYSTWTQAGGIFLGTLRNARNVTRSYSITDGSSASMEVPKVGTDATLIKGQRVSRFLFEGESAPQQFRIKRIAEPRGGGSHYTLELASVRDALVDATIVQEVTASGIVHFDAGLVQAEISEYIEDILLPRLAAAGQTHWALGVVEITELFDFNWVWNNPEQFNEGLLAAIKARGIACEFDVTETATEFELNYRTAIASAVPDRYVSVGRQLGTGTRNVDHTQQMTRAFVRGTEDADGVSATIAELTLRVVAVDAINNWLQVEDPTPGAPAVIAFDDQFNDLYVVKDAAAFASVQVTDTIRSSQRLHFASVTGFAVDDLIMFRRTSGENGEEISSVAAPAYISEYGDLARTVVIPSLRKQRNHVRKGDYPLWLAGDSAEPTGWTAFIEGDALTYSVEKETDPQYIIGDGFSARMKRTGADSGIALSAKIGLYQNFHVHRREGKSAFSGLVRFFLDTGSFADSLTHTVTVDLKTGSGGALASAQENSWTSPTNLIDGLYSIGFTGYDAEVEGRNDYRLRAHLVVSSSAIGGQLTIRFAQAFVVWGTLSDEELINFPFTRYSHANAGIHPANRALELYAPPLVDYETEVQDLEFIDPVKFSAERLVLGSHVRVRDPFAGGPPIRTRLVGIEHDDSNANTRVQLSSKRVFLTEII